MKRLFGTILLMFFLSAGLSGCKPSASYKEPLDMAIPRVPVKDWHRPVETFLQPLSDEEKRELSEYQAFFGDTPYYKLHISSGDYEKLKRWDMYMTRKNTLILLGKDVGPYGKLPDVRPGMKIRDAIADLDAFEKTLPKIGNEDFKKAEEAAERYSKSPESKKPSPNDPIDKCTDKYICGGLPGHKNAVQACYYAISPSVDRDWKPVDDMITGPLLGFEWANKKPNDFWLKRRERDILIQNDYGAYIRHTVTCYFNKKTGQAKIVFNRR